MTYFTQIIFCIVLIATILLLIIYLTKTKSLNTKAYQILNKNIKLKNDNKKFLILQKQKSDIKTKQINAKSIKKIYELNSFKNNKTEVKVKCNMSIKNSKSETIAILIKFLNEEPFASFINPWKNLLSHTKKSYSINYTNYIVYQIIFLSFILMFELAIFGKYTVTNIYIVTSAFSLILSEIKN
ncbi:hypothetical protein SAMN04488082_1075 [Desulfomicrobium apsheronum]|uniref:Uncharacterized protein n=1 Tax=Desulfomicrobium apsheronum TaxID=52560 RepID=A0A1I3U6R6_9BACT|nr:hypothetical protein [Desulfomicrobium apsheronum]SFJ77487.1 hypothetical protein SAMN04488082_1075 [Desulfomicrobium apsheronum]